MTPKDVVELCQDGTLSKDKALARIAKLVAADPSCAAEAKTAVEEIEALEEFKAESSAAPESTSAPSTAVAEPAPKPAKSPTSPDKILKKVNAGTMGLDEGLNKLRAYENDAMETYSAAIFEREFRPKIDEVRTVLNGYKSGKVADSPKDEAATTTPPAATDLPVGIMDPDETVKAVKDGNLTADAGAQEIDRYMLWALSLPDSRNELKKATMANIEINRLKAAAPAAPTPAPDAPAKPSFTEDVKATFKKVTTFGRSK